MKNILAVLLFVSFSVFEGALRSGDSGLIERDLQTHPCPPNHEKAEEILKGYLIQEKEIDHLRNQYNMNIDSSDKIRPLEEELDKAECKKLIENLNLAENERLHSFYKVADNYFIVNYLISENGEFEYKSTSIINNNFEFLGAYIPF